LRSSKIDNSSIFSKKESISAERDVSDKAPLDSECGYSPAWMSYISCGFIDELMLEDDADMIRR
jgi:hypothetical protein